MAYYPTPGTPQWQAWQSPGTGLEQGYAVEPPRRSRAALVSVIVVVIVLLLAGGGGLFAWRASQASSEPNASPSSTAGSSPSASPTPAIPNYNPAAPPIVVLGPVFAPNEATRTWKFQDWPFAFRTAANVTCQYKIGQPTYRKLTCARDDAPDQSSADVVLRKCASGCTPAERQEVERQTPSPIQGPLQVKDETTQYADVDYNNGRFRFTMIHYFATKAGGPLEWAVIYQATAPVGDKPNFLKAANDIRSQTP